MLLDKRELAGIRSGDIKLVFRRWRSPRVRRGTRIRTPVGLLEVTRLDRVESSDIVEADARAAGFAGLAELHGWMDDRPGDLFLIGLRRAGPDPRVALREQSDLSDDEVEELRARLTRMDTRAGELWTRETLRVIRDNPGRVSTELAAALGQERQFFKRRVRRLKELGLTESLEVGYRISPRGEAFLSTCGE